MAPTPTPSAASIDVANQSAATLTESLGAQRDPLAIVVPVTVVYCLIFLTGVVGNISTCIVIKKNRSMHTATNYYLFSLAISDFMLLLSGVPQEMYFIWSKYPYVFGEFFCIGRGLLAETSANATVLTITAFTVERYMAICHPFLGQAMSKLSRAIRIIILIWLLSVLTAVPQAAQFGIHSYTGVEKCVVVRVIVQHSFQLSTFIFFLAPMSIILVLYLCIGLHLYRSNVIGGGGAAVDGNQRRPQTTKTVQSDAILYRYAGTGSISGPQLSSVRGRLNHYGTRRVLRMLGELKLFNYAEMMATDGHRLCQNYDCNYQLLNDLIPGHLSNPARGLGTMPRLISHSLANLLRLTFMKRVCPKKKKKQTYK